MFLFDCGLCAGVYVIFKRLQKRGNRQLPRLQSDTQKMTRVEKNAAELAHYDHHLGISTFALGCVALGYIMPAALVAGLAVYSYTAVPLFKRAFQSLRCGRIDNEVITGAIITTCLFTQQYFALMIGNTFYYLAQQLLARTKNHTTSTLIDVCRDLPNTVWIIRHDQEIEISLTDLTDDDIVVVQAGDVIPVDGTVQSGQGLVDQQALTGELQPAEKDKGDEVFASTLLIAGKIWLNVDKKGDDTAISAIGRILNDETCLETSFQSDVEKWADRAAVSVMGLTALSLPFLAPASVAAVLNSSFGNRLIGTTSLATLNYITAAQRQGILIKDARALETLNQIDTILFDKTGTLTEARPSVGKITVDTDYTEKSVLAYAAAAEATLKHPIAQAIVERAIELSLELPDLEDSQYQVGFGVIAQTKQVTIYLGSARFMATEGIQIPDILHTAIASAHAQGFSAIVVAVNRTAAGVIDIQPTIRPEITDIMQQAKQYGVQRLMIVSGDHREPTRRLAETLGMDDYFYDVLPEQKAAIVAQLQADGRKVCFIGDGVNDALAIKQADVAISLSGASAVAVDLSEVVFLQGNLVALSDLLVTAKK